MKVKEVLVKRWLPQCNEMAGQTFTVPVEPGATVLQALLYIYDQLDSSLAFRYGCRYIRCGLCGVLVDGKPRLACRTKLSRAKEIAPLPRLPLLRDLVVDRSAYFTSFQGLPLYPTGTAGDLTAILHESSLHRNLMSCLECLCCVAACPKYSFGESQFAGPYLFVKLAQLHLDPRDTMDRKAQAREWGSGRCNGCGKCSCPNGIRLKQAVALLNA